MIRSILLIGTSMTASYFDIKTRKIPNWLCFSSIAIGLFLSRSFTSFVWHMFTLLFLFALSIFRLMGHGDMKLWMAISTYVNFEGTMYIMIIAAVMMIIYAMQYHDIIVFDTETSGVKPSKDYIVQLSARKFKNEGGELILKDKRNIYIRPPFFLDKKNIDIHGITNEFLQDKQTEEDAFSEIQEFFGENALLVGYNVDFDIDMLRGMYKRQKTELKFWYKLDVLEMARDILYGKEIEDYSLSTLIRHLGLDSGITFHQADDDVLATWRLMEYCYNEYKELRKTQPSSLEHVYINSIYFWKGYNKFQQGVYLNTSLGKMYYSTFQKAWFSSNINLERVDIDAIEREVLIRMGIDSNKELGKMTARKFENIKKGKQFV